MRGQACTADRLQQQRLRASSPCCSALRLPGSTAAGARGHRTLPLPMVRPASYAPSDDVGKPSAESGSAQQQQQQQRPVSAAAASEPPRADERCMHACGRGGARAPESMLRKSCTPHASPCGMSGSAMFSSAFLMASRRRLMWPRTWPLSCSFLDCGSSSSSKEGCEQCQAGLTAARRGMHAAARERSPQTCAAPLAAGCRGSCPWQPACAGAARRPAAGRRQQHAAAHDASARQRVRGDACLHSKEERLLTAASSTRVRRMLRRHALQCLVAAAPACSSAP